MAYRLKSIKYKVSQVCSTHSEDVASALYLLFASASSLSHSYTSPFVERKLPHSFTERKWAMPPPCSGKRVAAEEINLAAQEMYCIQCRHYRGTDKFVGRKNIVDQP